MIKDLRLWLEVTGRGSPADEENRQFSSVARLAPRQYNAAGGIVQFEVAEGRSDILARGT